MDDTQAELAARQIARQVFNAQVRIGRKFEFEQLQSGSHFDEIHDEARRRALARVESGPRNLSHIRQIVSAVAGVTTLSLAGATWFLNNPLILTLLIGPLALALLAIARLHVIYSEREEEEE